MQAKTGKAGNHTHDLEAEGYETAAFEGPALLGCAEAPLGVVCGNAFRFISGVGVCNVGINWVALYLDHIAERRVS